MKIINLDKFVDNLPLACSDYRTQITIETLNGLKYFSVSDVTQDIYVKSSSQW